MFLLLNILRRYPYLCIVLIKQLFLAFVVQDSKHTFPDPRKTISKGVVAMESHITSLSPVQGHFLCTSPPPSTHTHTHTHTHTTLDMLTIENNKAPLWCVAGVRHATSLTRGLLWLRWCPSQVRSQNFMLLLSHTSSVRIWRAHW